MSTPQPPAARPRDPAWVADVTAPGPNGVRFDDHPALVRAAVFPSGALSMYDSVTVSALPAGAPAYAGYYNGGFANLTALRARFPAAIIVTVTPNGAQGAMYIDIEPGDAVPAAAPGFIKAGGLGFYCSASTVAACVSACTAAGVPRAAYRIWSAHWTGRHICGPATCGYPQADGTQYASTAGWDESLVTSPAFFTLAQAVPPSANEWPLQSGSSGSDVAVLQAALNRRGFAAPLLVTDGQFGPLTAAAVRKAQTALGLVVTGTVNQALWQQLQQPPRTISGVALTWSDGERQALTPPSGAKVAGVTVSWSDGTHESLP